MGGGAGGGNPNPCVAVFAHPTTSTDQQLWDCAQTSGQLGLCLVSSCTTCACTSYVRSTKICTGGSSVCGVPLSGSGCSDQSYYAGAPFSCSGSKIPQSACMLRYLITHGYCQ
jgi:hypothetical protein